MLVDTYLIGSGAGFSGDRIDAAQPVVAALANSGRPAALVFETLGERTLALSQIVRRSDPSSGFDPYMEQFLAPILVPALRAGITIIGNFGAANPAAAAARVAEMASRDGLSPGSPPSRATTFWASQRCSEACVGRAMVCWTIRPVIRWR